MCPAGGSVVALVDILKPETFEGVSRKVPWLSMFVVDMLVKMLVLLLLRP
jgi:hypothetical protein